MNRFTFKQLCVIFFILLVIAFAGSLTAMELRAEEPRRAIVAMEMILGGDWIVPKVHGMNYYNKPPLFNWLLAGMFKLTGSFGEVPVRLPSLLAFLLIAYLVYRIIKIYTDRKTGVVGALLLLTSADIFFYGAVNSGEIDLFFALLVFVQAVSIFYYSQKQQWLRMFIISYVATALGILTKFLPAILFQGITLVVWLIYIKQFKKLFSWQHVAGILCCVLLSGSYFYLYSTRGDVGKLLVNLINESTQRSGLESSAGSSFFTFLQSPLLLFYTTLPGSLMLFYLFSKQVRSNVKHNPLFMFAFLFFVFNVPPYIITAQIHTRYLYPLFPVMAIMFTCIYFSAVHALPFIRRVVSYKAIAVTCIVLAVLRIGYNIWGIPYQEKTASELVFRKLASEIFVITKDHPIHITGKLDTSFADPSLPFIHIADTLFTPPFIQPQVPYYCSRHTNEIMRYDSIPQHEIFYIVPVNNLPQNNVTVYKYFEGWGGRKFALAVYHQ